MKAEVHQSGSMAQAGSNPYQDDTPVDESGNKASSFLSKLKDKTVEHGRKLKTKIQDKRGGSDSTNSGDTDETGLDDSDETVNNFDSGATGQPEQEDQSAETGDGDDSGLTKDFQGLSTNEKPAAPESQSADSDQPQDSDKPMTDTVQDNVTSATNQTKEAVGLGGAGAGAGASEQQSAPEGSSEATTDPQQAGKTWSQWATDQAGVAKDTAAANAPTAADGTPYHQKAYDAAVGAKDSAYDTAMGAKDNAIANAPKTADGTPYHQKAYDTAVGAKDSVASQIPDQSSIPSDPAQQTYFQKAAGGIYGAKDSFFSATQPADHHKALSQQVTESVGNLPATLKSSLGFGKTASSPTTTPGISSGEGAPEEAAGAPPQSPGLVSRITGLFGTKKPATEESTPSTETPSEGTESTDAPQSS